MPNEKPFVVDPIFRGPENPEVKDKANPKDIAFERLLQESQKSLGMPNKTPEVAARQAFSDLQTATQTEKDPKFGFPFAVTPFARAVAIADSIDQKAVKAKLSTAPSDQLKAAAMLPVATRLEFALACFRSGDPSATKYGEKLYGEALKMDPRIQQDMKAQKAIEEAKKIGLTRDVGNYGFYGGSGTDSTVKNGDAPAFPDTPAARRPEGVLPPPPDFAQYYAERKFKPKPQPASDTNPKPPQDGGKPPQDAAKPPKQEKPDEKQPTGVEREKAVAKKDETETWAKLLGLGAAALGGYAAYRGIQRYRERYDDLRNATEIASVRVEPERTTNETEIRNRKTRELLDKSTWDAKTGTFKDSAGNPVSVKDVDIEFKIGKAPDGVDSKQWVEEQRAKMKGQLDLELRGRGNLGGLLSDVSVVADEKATPGSKKMMLKQADGAEGEIQRATQDGKVEVKRADGKVEVVDVKPGDKVEMRIGGKLTPGFYSQRDAVGELAYQLGRKSDLEFAKKLGEFGGDTTHKKLADQLDRAAKNATGESKTALEKQAEQLRAFGDAPIDRGTRATMAEALRAQGATIRGEQGASLIAVADNIMPKEVADEINRQKTVEEKAPEVKAEEKPPEVKPEEKPPEVKPEEKPPEVKADEKPPEVKADEKPPEVKPEEKPPEVKADEKPPEVKADEKPPEVKADEKPPEVKADEKPPEVKADEKPPEVKPEEKPPEAKPKERTKTSGRNRGPADPVVVAPERGEVVGSGDTAFITDKAPSAEVQKILDKWSGKDVFERDLSRHIAKMPAGEQREQLEKQVKEIRDMPEGANKEALKRTMAEFLQEVRTASRNGKTVDWKAMAGRVTRVAGATGTVIAVGMLVQVLMQNESGHQDYRPGPIRPDLSGN